MKLRRLWLAVLMPAFFAPARTSAQEQGAAALASLVEGLSVSTRVLMIAAHPDDEDTQLITWLSRGRHVETAYLSLNRGDGGQNLLGNELGDALGAIRTEELLAARRLDGGKQYFTRAYDFGFSKTAAETFTQWNHDAVLEDVVTIVRAFRPQVIVAVFTGTPRDGHGHHQASGIMAKEAYELSADTVRFPRTATAGLGPWSVLKFYRVSRGTAPTIRINTGELDPLLGRSYGELADMSRSQHKSQAMGQLQRPGVRLAGLTLEASRVSTPGASLTEKTMFDGIDTTWARFQGVVKSAAGRTGLDSLPDAFVRARASLDVTHPERLVAALGSAEHWLDALCPPEEAVNACVDRRAPPDDAGRPHVVNGDLSRAVEVARGRIEQALAIATGALVEATADREVWAVGNDVPVQIEVFNRGTQPLTVRSIATAGLKGTDRKTDVTTLEPDSAERATMTGEMTTVTRPWWLATPRVGAMFGPRILGVEESTRPTTVESVVEITTGRGTSQAQFTIRTPVVYRSADPLRGEVDRPIAGAPAISLLLDHDIEYAPANTPIQRSVQVHVTSASSSAVEARVTLSVPKGLFVDSATRSVTLAGPGAQSTVTFNLRGRLPPGRQEIRAVATNGSATFAEGYTAIAYEHIRTQRMYRPSVLALEAVDVKLPPNTRVGYIAGVGDNVAPTLQQLGIDVVPLDPSDLARTDLTKFTTIVVGSRAYEADPALVANNAALLDYVKNGGTAVVQYGQYEMQRPGMMPYPITLARPADRVTVETAPVEIIDPTAQVLNAPNKISSADFSGWLQDLSLYMPRTFDPRYAAPLAMNDPGEPPNKGAILVAAFGKGTYVYTTLAFFRQLPNGVPGAARLFLNLLAAKAERVAQ